MTCPDSKGILSQADSNCPNSTEANEYKFGSNHELKKTDILPV
jgi:hypothetical protein